MAWTWRKRKTIIPGVRLNFGKKGVSTTIGPRGASMTFGPNGTYLNTSIPGTGLYNRQRTGGKGDYTMSNNTEGCKGGFVTFISIVMWCLVILTALMGLAINPWLTVAMLAVIFLAHYISARIAKKEQATISQTVTPETTEIPTVAVAGGGAIDTSKIKDEYFSQIAKIADDLYTDYEKVLKLPNIEKLIDSMGVNINMTINNTPKNDVEHKVKLLFWIDLTRCYLALGHLIDFSSKEGLGLFYFTARTEGCVQCSKYTTFDAVSFLYKKYAEDILKGIKSHVDSVSAPSDVFWVSRLLANNNTILHRKFLVDIYRFASLTAKADNTVTDEEAEWLANIMKLQAGGGSEIISDEIVENEGSKSPQTGKVSTKTRRPSATSAMKELKSLIGLESVKQEVEALSNFIKIQQTREAKGLKTSSVSYHCVFTGNPGTGKTTVARVLAKIYKGLGVVSKGHLVETDRAGLVAEYVGQTAVKTNKIIDSALDGVLFIDEAYSLVSKSESDYGKEAIATLLKRMEDDRDRLIVILAGYTNEMKDFIDTNPGLQSRFNRYIEFPDYNEDELFQIFMRSVEQYEYTLSDEAVEGLKDYFKEQVANKDKNFGNGRLVRNIFEKTLERQANRLAHEVNLTTEKLSQIDIQDLPLK